MSPVTENSKAFTKEGQGFPDLLPLPTGNFTRDLQNGWLDYLARFEPYNWYVTLTFKDPVHPEQADKRFRRWIRKLNEYLYGRRYREAGRSVTWVRALEYQRRDVIPSQFYFATKKKEGAQEVFSLLAEAVENKLRIKGMSRGAPLFDFKS